jgi:hypothetical protein
MKAIIIRPNDMSAFNRSGRHDYLYHLPYRARGKSTFYDQMPANQRTLIKIFGYLHGYASHGTKAMYKRWKSAERRFMNRHMADAGGHRNTCRFVNEYTAHRWM